MINKTSHPIKVKVEKNISTKTNHRTTEKNGPSSKITLSIELLKGIISLVFMVLAIICFLLDLVAMFYNLSKTDNLLACILLILNPILVIFSVVVEGLFLTNVKRKKTRRMLLVSLGVSLFISGLCLFADDICNWGGFSVNYISHLSLMYASPIFICVFIAIYCEIQREEDRSYVVGYFSAITSFAALIVALVSLKK